MAPRVQLGRYYGFFNNGFEMFLGVAFVSCVDGEVSCWKSTKGRTGMDPVDFVEEPLATNDFAFFERFGEFLERVLWRRGSWSMVRLRPAEAIDGFQESFRGQEAGGVRFRVRIIGPRAYGVAGHKNPVPK